MLLLWGAHCNVQVVTNQAWSKYFLKYTMKAEPEGALNMSSNALEAMGFQPEDRLPLQVATPMVSSRPVGTVEAAYFLLGHDVVQASASCKVDYVNSCKVDYVNSDPPAKRKAYIGNGQVNTCM